LLTALAASRVCDAPRAGRGQISLSFNSDGVLVEAPLLVQRARARPGETPLRPKSPAEGGMGGDGASSGG